MALYPKTQAAPILWIYNKILSLPCFFFNMEPFRPQAGPIFQSFWCNRGKTRRPALWQNSKHHWVIGCPRSNEKIAKVGQVSLHFFVVGFSLGDIT